jgi:hypothetical protein
MSPRPWVRSICQVLRSVLRAFLNTGNTPPPTSLPPPSGTSTSSGPNAVPGSDEGTDMPSTVPATEEAAATSRGFGSALQAFVNQPRRQVPGSRPGACCRW